MTIREIGVIANEEVDDEGETGMDEIGADVGRRPRGLRSNLFHQRNTMELLMYELITDLYEKVTLTYEMARSRVVERSSSCRTISQVMHIIFIHRKLP